MWQKQDDGIERDYEAAITYCNGLQLGGYSGWRLPTLKELLSVVSVGMPGNAVRLFSGAKPERYWTATELDHTLDGQYLGKTIAYTVDFADGRETSYNKTGEYYVRAVRTMIPEQEAMVKFCTYAKQNIKIIPITGNLTCTKSLPTANTCTQYKCKYHNTMIMSAFLQKSIINPNARDEEVMAAMGARDFCR